MKVVSECVFAFFCVRAEGSIVCGFVAMHVPKGKLCISGVGHVSVRAT